MTNLGLPIRCCESSKVGSEPTLTDAARHTNGCFKHPRVACFLSLQMIFGMKPLDPVCNQLVNERAITDPAGLHYL